MSNSAHITSDLKHAVVNDAASNGKISIGKRGVLLTVLGNEMVGSEVTSDLDRTLSTLLRGKKPFYEFEADNLHKNHLCVSYQEQNNALFIIGVSDLVISFAVPEEIKPDHITAFAVKLKSTPDSAIMAKHVVLVRREGKTGRSKKLAFYLVESNA